MLDIEIGDRAALKTNNEKLFLITGYYKAQPFEPISCKITRKIFEELEAEEKAEGTYIQKLRIVPCEKSEVEYFSTNHDWVKASDTVLLQKQPHGEAKTKTLSEGHEAHLKSFLEDGELSIWGRIQLTVR